MNTLKRPLTAADVMTRDPVCVARSTRIRELARVFEENEISGAPVVDQKGELVGVVSRSDLIRRCSEGTDEVPPAYLFELLSEKSGKERTEASELVPEPLICVDDFMTIEPISVTVDEPVSSVARTMHERKIHRVIVVDGSNFPIGIITSLDLLKFFPK